MGSSLFGRIARHPRREGSDEREDRLTEVLAAVLAHPACEDLGWFLAKAWLNAAFERHLACSEAIELLRASFEVRPVPCVVRTQFVVHADGRVRRPDLELRFHAPLGPDVVIWVEVKHGTGPGDKQLCDYVLAQRLLGFERGLVLLLAPRADYSQRWFERHKVPESVPSLTWQETAETLRQYNSADETARFLVAELCNYLREERLMGPSAF